MIPESDAVLEHNAYREQPPTITVTESALVLLYQLGGPTQLRTFSIDGKPRPGPAEVPASQVSSVNALGGDEVLFTIESFVLPSRLMRYNARTGATTALVAADGSQPWNDISVEYGLRACQCYTLPGILRCRSPKACSSTWRRQHAPL